MNLTFAAQGIIDEAYRDYALRIDHINRSFGDCIDGVEIGFFAHQTEEIDDALARIKLKGSLRQGEENSLHVAMRPGEPLQRQWLDVIMARANEFYRCGLIAFMGFHLDMIDIFPKAEALADPGLILTWEPLGSGAVRGNLFSEAEEAARRHPNWKATLDVSHIYEMVRLGEPDIGAYLNRFCDMVRQIHFSYPDNLYDRALVGEDIMTSHSLVSLCDGEGERFFGLIPGLDTPTITIEGVIPPGSEGEALLRKEVVMIRKWREAG